MKLLGRAVEVGIEPCLSMRVAAGGDDVLGGFVADKLREHLGIHTALSALGSGRGPRHKNARFSHNIHYAIFAPCAALSLSVHTACRRRAEKPLEFSLRSAP